MRENLECLYAYGNRGSGFVKPGWFTFVMAGHSRSKNGVVEFTLGLAEGKTRGLAYVPAIHVLLAESKKDVDARIRGHDVLAQGQRYTVR
jgi:hypothetical protein